MGLKSAFSAATVLGLAASVTAGSVYVTSNAAVVQDEARNVGAPEVRPVAASRAPTIAPEAVRHDRSSDIILDAQGGFVGQLFVLGSAEATVPAANMSVRVLLNGDVVAETTTDATGRFAVNGLNPGVIGIIARGESGVLISGAHLVAATEQHPANLETDIQTVAIAPKDVPLAVELMRAGVATSDERFSKSAAPEDKNFAAGSGEMSTSLLSHRVQLGEDGRLPGTVSILDPRTGSVREVLDETVFFLKNGVVVSSARVGLDGSFVASGLVAGLYSVVGAGKDGVFALGIEVVEFEAAQAERAKGGYSTVAIQASLGLSATPVGPNNLNASNFEDNLGDGSEDNSAPPTPPTPPAPAGAAGGGGSFGGGGGGAGGGGGLGALLGAGLGAGLGYLAGNDNNSSSPGN